MKNCKILTFVFLLISLVFNSCNGVKEKSLLQLPQDTVEVNRKKVDTNVQNESELVKLYQTTNKDKSEMIVVSSTDKFADKNFILIAKYRTNKESKILINRDTLVSLDDYSISVDKKDFSKKIIDKKEYLFFFIEENPMGQFSSETILNFFMIDINHMSYYNIEFAGNYTLRSRSSKTLEGEFTSNKALDKNKSIKQILLKYAIDNRLIYKPSEAEKDIFYYKNYAIKWRNDNNIKEEVANGFTEIPNKIVSTYYKDNIIDFTGDISDSDVLIENSNYKIVSFWRYSIIAYDKTKRLYFPVFIESCITGCNKSIEFVAPHKIKITHNEFTGNDYNPEENPDVDVVNLKDIIFKN